jgi:hypothetical protein
MAKNLSETDLEFLMLGFLTFSGETHNLKTVHLQRRAYEKNKAFLLGQIGGELCPWGFRPWCWWRFEHEDDMTGHYLEFAKEYPNGDTRACLVWLKRNDFPLLHEEEKNFERQERIRQDEIEQCRPKGKQIKKFFDFEFEKQKKDNS